MVPEQLKDKQLAIEMRVLLLAATVRLRHSGSTWRYLTVTYFGHSQGLWCDHQTLSGQTCPSSPTTNDIMIMLVNDPASLTNANRGDEMQSCIFRSGPPGGRHPALILVLWLVIISFF
jgi:hypothetical protein